MSVKQLPAGPRTAAAYLMLRLSLKTSEVFRPHSGRPLGGIRPCGPGAHSAGPATRCRGESCWIRVKKAGQVTIELLLVLPVFMLLLFFIMEMGNMGFNTILAHHCTYELARIGSLVAGPTGSGSGGGQAIANMKMKKVLDQMFNASPNISVDGVLVPTLKDRQSGQMGEDLVVTLKYRYKLIFPGSSQLLSDVKGQRVKNITVSVQMPVEKPYFQ